MAPFGKRGGSQESRAVVAVTMKTSRFLGGELGAVAEPEPRSSAAEPSRARQERRERRDSGNITTELSGSLCPALPPFL